MKAIYDVFGLGGGMSQAILLGTLLVMRIIPIIFQTPFLGGKLVPAETRMGLAFGLSVLCYPFAKQQLQGPIDTSGLVYVVLMLKELFVGYVIGFLASELFYAMEIGGRAVDVMRGSNMAEVQVPELQLRASPFGEFSFQLLLIVFCALDGHAYFIQSVIESFRVVPADGWPAMHGGFENFTKEILEYTSQLFAIAFALVFPGLFAAFIIDVVFGMFNRVAPQLNAYFMAMGIKALAGIAMFMFALSLLLGQLADRLEKSLVFVRHIIDLMG
jgi:flagellar biosynthetic protein FliR